MVQSRLLPSPLDKLRRSLWADDPMVVRFEWSCVVPDDPGSIVQHAHPITDEDRRRIREQQIGRMRRDDTAILARELRVHTADYVPVHHSA